MPDLTETRAELRWLLAEQKLAWDTGRSLTLADRAIRALPDLLDRLDELEAAFAVIQEAHGVYGIEPEAVLKGHIAETDLIPIPVAELAQSVATDMRMLRILRWTGAYSCDCHAFPLGGSVGTLNCVRKARAAKFKVTEHEPGEH